MTRKNEWLEVMRGVAALVVVLNHIGGLSDGIKNNLFIHSLGIWGFEAVTVFFVLSGIVIRFSVDKHHYSTFEFYFNRLKRLVPGFWVVCTIVLVVEVFYLSNSIEISQIIYNFLFCSTLHGDLSSSFSLNPPEWSLTFEIFFYFLFGLSLGKFHRQFMIAWVLLVPIAWIITYSGYFKPGLGYHFIYLLSHSGSWLLGYYLKDFKKYISFSFQQGLAIFAMIPLIGRMHLNLDYHDAIMHFMVAFFTLPLFSVVIESEKPSKWQFKNYLVLILYLLVGSLNFYFTKSTKLATILYLTFPLAVYFGKDIFQIMIIKCKSVGVFIGKISYSMYLTNFVIISLIGATDLPVIIKVGITFFVLILVSYALDVWFQGWVNKNLKWPSNKTKVSI
jgi:peptidoglycan/LPS O-acetylase OafA/YrhL